ncbi:MAG: hypothetical protein QGG05_02225 [Candidatus Latescibacteria bacterium]|jgi:hypothetical protein|nr:hypothetical protein [Candidatus Latescibacterota bacterium]
MWRLYASAIPVVGDHHRLQDARGQQRSFDGGLGYTLHEEVLDGQTEVAEVPVVGAQVGVILEGVDGFAAAVTPS